MHQGYPISTQTTIAYGFRELIDRLVAVREEIYRTGELADADGGRLPVWPVGLTKGRGEALRGYAMSVRAVRCIETGLGLAMSSSFLMEASLRTLESREGAGGGSGQLAEFSPLLTSIDPGETTISKDAGLVHLRSAGLESLHRFIAAPSELTLPRLIEGGERYDLGFVDGDHRFDAAMLDTSLMLRLVKPGGLIVLDDAWMPSVRKASAFFVSNGLCECVDVYSEGGKPRLHALKPAEGWASRAWDHFVEF